MICTEKLNLRIEGRMMFDKMKIDHIGYAVKRIDRAINALNKLGYVFGPVIDDLDRNVQLVFGNKDGYRIELVSPLNKKKKPPVDQYLSNATGTPYHICYVSSDFEKDIESLKEFGFKIIIEPRAAIAFDYKRVVFMMNIGFGLMEIVEE